MKKNLHPKFYKQAKVKDLASGEEFTLGSTQDSISVEISSLSHPFYTKKHRIVDTESMVRKFENKRKATNLKKVTSKKEKRQKRIRKSTSIKGSKELTLKDMFKEIQ